MVIDIAGIVYLILALYIIGAILITGLLTLGIWGFLKFRKRDTQPKLKHEQAKPIKPDRSGPNLPHRHAPAM